MSEMQLEKQEILTGSSRLTNRKRRSFDRINYMLKYMEFNKAYIYKISNNGDKQKSINTLEQFKKDILITEKIGLKLQIILIM